MDPLLMNVDWTAVIVGAVLAYALGAAWYGDALFGKKWKMGIGTPAVPNMPMMPGMLTQAIGTFLLAWVVGVVEASYSTSLAILIALTIGALIKANGFFAGKTRYAIAVETMFVLVMVAVMLLVHIVL